MKKNILIVDDHPFIINGLESMINGFDEFTLVGKASNGKEALQILDNNSVDIVFTDIEMPEMDGLELIEIINTTFPEINIVVLTMHSHHWMIKKILKLNVDAVLSKSAGDIDFSNAIEAIERKEKYYDSNVVSIINDNDAVTKNSSDITILSFTERELEILQLIYEGLTSKEISEKMNKSINTIESHRKNLFIKCGVKNVAGLIKFSLNKGFLEP